MSVMNAFAAARLEIALGFIDEAIDHLGGAVDRVPREVLLKARGELHAMKQLLDMQDELAVAKTEPSGLRLVK